MNAAAWVCLLLPLASTIVITLGGNALPVRDRRLRNAQPAGEFAYAARSTDCFV